jgi:hypothetical protein
LAISLSYITPHRPCLPPQVTFPSCLYSNSIAANFQKAATDSPEILLDGSAMLAQYGSVSVSAAAVTVLQPPPLPAVVPTASSPPPPAGGRANREAPSPPPAGVAETSVAAPRALTAAALAAALGVLVALLV